MLRWLAGGFLALSAFAAPAAAAPQPVQSVVLGFHSITNNNAGDVVIGERQLSVTVEAISQSQATFTFNNSGAAAATITTIYFDDMANAITKLSIGAKSASVSYQTPVAKRDAAGNLPGGNPIGFNADFSIDRTKKGGVHNGIDRGEHLTLLADLSSGFNVQTMMDELKQGGRLRIGFHVQAFASGGSESFVSIPIHQPIPTPEPRPVALLGLAVLGLAAARRRR